MVEVVCERGYAGASLELVLARAGVPRGTFYRCFEGRDACFQELLDLASARSHARSNRLFVYAGRNVAGWGALGARVAAGVLGL
jgi:AcrR family transcriptional regulator